MTLGQRDHAHRRRHPALEHKGVAPLRQPVELGGAAADIDDEHGLHRLIEQVQAAADGQSGLLDGVDDPQLQARAEPNTLDEGLAVLGLAAGLGGDGHEAGGIDAALGHPLAAKEQGLVGPVHRGVVQTPCSGQAFAQTNDATEGVDHPEAVTRRFRDQQAAVVGPEVQCAIQGRIAT